MHPAEYFRPIQILLEELGSPEIAQKSHDYLKGLHVFYGLKQDLRRKTFKEFIKSQEIPSYDTLPRYLEWLYAQPQREWHYCAVEWALVYKKQWDDQFLEWAEFLVRKNSWWDTVDYIAGYLVGEYLKKHPEKQDEYVKKWADDADMWINRIAIIYQLKYKEKTRLDLLTYAIEKHTDSKEFFHQKAIGWALRQYAKTDPDWVRQYVAKTALKPLSEREAMKHINNFQ